MRRLSTAGLLVGTLLFAFSLTPSLLPRSVTFQGLVSGMSLSLGYGIGCIARWLWSYLGMPVPGSRVKHIFTIAAASACFAVGAGFLRLASDWQNSVRALMGMEQVDGVRPLSVALIALLLFAALLLIARQFRRTYGFLSGKLHRFVPRRVGNVVGVILSAVLFWALVDGVLLAMTLRTIDGSYKQLDALIHEEVNRPDDPMRTGSRESLIPWQDLGQRGREFVSSAPTANELGVFFSDTATEPIRVYVGLNAADSPEERARLALRELVRVGGFQRAVLLIATPTGTGWVDPAAVNTLEYLHRGNVATVAAQYSYLPSPVALMAEGAYGAEMARVLFAEVYTYWTKLPRDNRPALYLQGVSLGALNSDLSFDLYDILPDPFHGALWSGPPFRSVSWRDITASRAPGSPEWLPRFRDGSVVRFMNQQGGLETPPTHWGPLRIAYLQYASDPVTFFSLRSFYVEPSWIREPRGHDVSPSLRWYPVVTMLQLAADIGAGVRAAPPGFGHNFAAEHYIDAWLALTEPDGWTEDDIRRLKSVHAASR